MVKGKGKAKKRPQNQGGAKRANGYLPGRPVTVAKAIRFDGPRVNALKSVRIQNQEQIDNVYGSGTSVHTYAVQISGKSAPWLSQVSRHFQVIRFHSVSLKYETSASTSMTGTVTIAPYYLKGIIPARRVDSSDQGVVSSHWVRNLAGAVSIQVAGALKDIGNQAKFIVMNAARKIFRTLVLASAGAPLASLGNSNAVNDADDLSPGSFIVSVESTETTATRIGNLVMIYDVELSDPGPDMSAEALWLLRVTTDSAALALETAYTDGFISGDVSVFGLYGNKITFNNAGSYFVTFNWIGSTPVPAALTMVDSSANNALDSRAGEAWKFSTLALSDNTTGQIASLATAAGALQIYKFTVRPGDVLTIPTLSSGTITSVAITISKAPMDLNLLP